MNVAVEEILGRLELVGVEAGRRSADIEAARSLPPDLVDALVDTGVFRLTVPVGLGGVAANLGEVLRATRSLAYHDGSVGWVVVSALLAGAAAAALPRHHAATVLGQPRTIVAGHGGSGGAARRTEDGGLVVNGRWSWGTGVANATWIAAGVRIEDDRVEDAAGRSDDGSAAAATPGFTDVRCLFRRDQVVVLDTWHAIGLRGAGATDFQVTEAFVPEGRWVEVADGSGTAQPLAGSLSGVADDDLGAVTAAAVALALADRAIDEVLATGTDAVRGRPTSTASADLARLATLVAAADRLLDHTVAVADGVATSSGRRGPPSPGLGAAAINAVEAATTAIERCYRMAGPPAVFHANVLQRLLRDVQVVAQHPMVSPDRWPTLWPDAGPVGPAGAG